MTQPRFLPAEAPLAMPVQSLHQAPPHSGRPTTAPRGLFLRRLFVIGGAVIMTAGGGAEMYRVFNGNGPSVLGILILVLFVVLFAWIALSFMSAVGGFCASLAGGGLGLGIAKTGPLPALRDRTALLMPTYNEEPARVMAGLKAIHGSLTATGQSEHFDIFILSDTTDPDVWIAEEAAFLAFRAEIGPAAPRLFYRRRARNTDRKAGNIAEWVRRFGGAYPQMLTLDADSLMEGETVLRMAAAMEAHPGVGLIQTLPVIAGGTSLFARMQQFAGRVYGPVIAQGIAWWHGSEGNYWGHNAVIRTQAFAEQAGLPHLKGRKPFGGAILSHDFVEAALMRRGGWAIHMVPALGGSYEESPPSLTDVAIRDRRWAQGNLQHAGVLPTRGLHWVSRLHLLMGIGSYITSPLWLCFLLVGVLVSLQSRFVQPQYFGATKSLFPRWPQVDPVLAKWVFIGTMAVLLAPKLFAYILLLVNGPMRRGSGGALRALLSLLLETLIGGLVAPVAMLIQTEGVMQILAGRDSGWNAQRRDSDAAPLRLVWRQYWRFMAFGIGLAVIAYAVSPALFLWMTPVLVGLVLAVPLVMLTASSGVGLALQRMGLLSIPEERQPNAILRSAAGLRAAEAPSVPGASMQGAIRHLLGDAALLAAHRAMLPPARRPGQDPIDVPLLVGLTKIAEADTLQKAIDQLSKQETAAVLGSADGLDRLQELATAFAVLSLGDG
ncbi:glucans biosynthesis glucosyltransferase MdoH [Acidisoma cellulosilytica]|uniref:Glucans biosynthesis glucosyltransferase H n=1 Tax=Acidisoma cellulosilyticum TaxID=2802395 RepID=A0A963Z1N6_9PROT|nr:glucans biosynthesis glucosyltransferase MdoH [Acidisoma cellulosilyticum]MCB8881001.1 glucans biosynthesis glucosyltransferase MdoH [Acidisoma cellulosilyticum]